MAKGKSRRRDPNFTSTIVLGNVGLGALATATLVSGSLVAASDEAYRAISVDLTWSMAEHTAQQGPIMVGIAHGDYSDTEIEEWLEATAAINRGDLIAKEKASRRCRHVGTFSGLSSSESLFDGRIKRTKLGWAMTTGKTLKVWGYNLDADILTTGSLVKANGRMYLRYI